MMNQQGQMMGGQQPRQMMSQQVPMMGQQPRQMLVQGQAGQVAVRQTMMAGQSPVHPGMSPSYSVNYGSPGQAGVTTSTGPIRRPSGSSGASPATDRPITPRTPHTPGSQGPLTPGSAGRHTPGSQGPLTPG